MALEMLPPPVPPTEGESLDDSPAFTSVSEATSSLPRLLTPEEVATLAPIFAERGATLPAPEHSFFVGTVDDQGAVTSFLVVQLRVHAEPLWIKPGNERVFRGLVTTAEEILAERVQGAVEVYLFAPAGKVARMAEVAGMQMEPWVVYSKRVEGAQKPVEASTEVN